MKYMWLIFSFFILTLSILPCSENEECETLITTTISQNNHQNKHKHESEQCIPFCNCSHCPASAFYQSAIFYTFKNKIKFLDKKEKLSFYSFIYNKKIADKIWQPPKIS